MFKRLGMVLMALVFVSSVCVAAEAPALARTTAKSKVVEKAKENSKPKVKKEWKKKHTV